MSSLQTIAGARPVACTLRPRVSCNAKSFAGVSMPKIHLRLVARQPTRNVTKMGLFGLGAPELAVIAGVVALIYGPSKLPEVGKGLGKTFKSFQSAAKEFEKELKDGLAEDEEPKKDAEKK